MKVVDGIIPNGLDDIAKHLGIDNSKAIFLHSTSFDENNPKNLKRKTVNKGKMLYAEIISYSSNTINGAKSAISYYSTSHLNYLDEIGFLRKDNIIKVYDGKNLYYPYNSVSTMLNKKIKEDEEFRKSLEGYTIVSSYLSDEDIESAKLINGKTLMSKESQIKANSKHYLRVLGKKKNYSVAPGNEFIGIYDFNIDNLRRDYPESNLYIKLENQSGGSGNIFIENFFSVSDEEIITKVKELALKIYDISYIENEMPFIAEIDLRSIKGVEVVENIGVNAVITPDKVTILGGTSQETHGSKYIGSVVRNSTYEYIDVAKKYAKDAFVALAEEGYYGYMTIDMMVTKENNEYKAYNVDPNARFSAGTMLLKNIHYAQEKLGKKVYGVSFANSIPSNEDSLLMFKNAIKGIEYNKDTGLGIVPVLINDVTEVSEGKYYLKTVLIDESYEICKEKFEKYKEYFKK